MTFDRRRAPSPGPASGTFAHPAGDRRQAVTQWLLATVPAEERGRVRWEWSEHGTAVLPLGALFSAVRIPGRLVHAVAGTDAHEAVDDLLAEALDDGPVIRDMRGSRYYALLPSSVPRTWRQAAEDWRTQGIGVLGRGSYLGVPRPDALTPGPSYAAYWSVPLRTPGTLCRPLAVARLIAVGRDLLNEPEP